VSQLAQGTTIEGPDQQGRTLARREPIPKELAALGVTVAVDPQSEMQILIIPKELRERANVLTPVQAFQQADPNWRPSLRVVELDPAKDGPHFYPQTGGRLAPRKQALELLADAAGVVSVRTSLSGRERVVVGDVTAETFTHLAVLQIRKSDGTLRVLEASRTYEPYAEYEEITTAVASGQYAKQPGTDAYTAEVRKRWLNEIKFAKAKNESKAILRAIRAALQIPHTFSGDRAGKPFVVVGWNLSPQDTPEVRQAIASLYAGDSADPIPVHEDWLEQRLSLEAAADVDETSPAADGAREPVGEPAAGERGPGDGAASAPAPPPTEPETPAEPEIPGLEPEPEEHTQEDGLTQEERAQVTAFGKTKPPFGTFQTKTMAQIFQVGEPANEWIDYALRRETTPRDAEFHRLLVLACRVHRPELYDAWRAEQ
jgi:hypothetical protein